MLNQLGDTTEDSGAAFTQNKLDINGGLQS